MLKIIDQLRNKIQQQSPLILNLTNHVTMDFVANGLLSLGASPVMSEALEDILELTPLADAITINMGTINEVWFENVLHICQHNVAKNNLIVFDPVGCGATAYRTQYAQQILATNAIDIIRGNASEIMALTNTSHKTHGVNSTAHTTAALTSAQHLAQRYGVTVVISGEIDLIVDASQSETIHGGSALMPLITGTGCLLTAVVAAFAAVSQDPFVAAIAACSFYKHAGATAEQQAQGPGTFKPHFIDALYA